MQNSDRPRRSSGERRPRITKKMSEPDGNQSSESKGYRQKPEKRYSDYRKRPDGSSTDRPPRKDNDGHRSDDRNYSRPPHRRDSGQGDYPRKRYEGGGDKPRYSNYGNRRDDRDSGNWSERNVDGNRADNERPAYRGNRSSNDNLRYPRKNYGGSGNDRPYSRGGSGERRNQGDRPQRRYSERNQDDDRGRRYGDDKPYKKRTFDKDDRPTQRPKFRILKPRGEDAVFDKPIRLNKYIANSGVCSRREADQLIVAGAIKVNGVVVTELGSKVNPGDKIQYGDETLSLEKMRYVLLNKPKGYITTTEDPDARNTVMQLVSGACRERIYPVGRLDRNTTGLILLTNDGAMATKLAHPKHGVIKVYHVVLDKNLLHKDLLQIKEGVELEDGTMKVDKISYIEPGDDKREIGIEIHSGRNRIVRRIFEALGYKVDKLDRTMYAGLTKKNLPRGHYRFLEEHEVNMLKMLS